MLKRIYYFLLVSALYPFVALSQNLDENAENETLADSVVESILSQKRFDLFYNTVQLRNEPEFASCDPLALEISIYKVCKALLSDAMKETPSGSCSDGICIPEFTVGPSQHAAVKDSLLSISYNEYEKYIKLRKNFSYGSLARYNSENPQALLDVRSGVYVIKDSVNDSRTTYKGTFINNICDGDAHFIYRDDKNGIEVKCMGYYAYGLMYGRGQEVIKYDNSYRALYNGYFIGNSKNGYGTLLLMGKNTEEFNVEYDAFRFYSENNILNVKMEGVFKNNVFVEGTMTTTSGNVFTGKFKDGVLIEGEHSVASGKDDVEPLRQYVATDLVEDKDAIYNDVDQKPEFPGGMSALKEYLRDNIRYPKNSLVNKSRGRAVVRFIVDIDGSVTDVEVMRGTGDLYLDAEAIRVVLQMPNWYPAKHRGELVRCYYVIPIVFRLQ